jgi:hypothetical protein
MYQPLGSVIPLPQDRQEEIGKELEEIFRAAWQNKAFDWPGIIKHFADKYGPGKADAYFMGILVGKQFAKDKTFSFLNSEL